CTWMRARSVNMWLKALAVVDDRDQAAVTARLEQHTAVALGEDRVVAADPGTRARPEACPALADDDRARGHALAVADLDAEHLGRRIAPVPGSAEPLLVSHLVFVLVRLAC